MPVTAEKKKELFQAYGGNEKNSGSVESQIALFTERINHLTEHLRENKKDAEAKKLADAMNALDPDLLRSDIGFPQDRR